MSQTTWNINNYDGAGLPIKDDESGKVLSIIMTVEQEKQHDRGYRQYLIKSGKLTPKKKNVR